MMNIRIAIAEDNSFLVQAIKEKIALFEDFIFEFRGANGAELIGKLEADHNIDVILMDIQMPEMDGIKATEIIKNKYPQIKIIMLTVFDDDDNIFNAIQAGADGYFLKEVDPQSLYDGILDVINGGASMTPSIAMKALKLLRQAPQIQKQNTEKYTLSKRETEVLEHLSKGLNYHKIAENLFISPATVRKHIENIYKKLQVHNKVEAISKANRHNLI